MNTAVGVDMVLLRGTSSSVHFPKKTDVCCLICTLGVQTDTQYPLRGHRLGKTFSLYKWTCGTGTVTTGVVETFNNVDATTKIAVIT